MRNKISIANKTYLIFGSLIGVWSLVWWFKIGYLDIEFISLTTSSGSFVFWTIAKVFIWILPALLLIKLSGKTLREVFNFSGWRRWLMWGAGAGFMIALTGWIPHYLSGSPVFPTVFSFALLNVLVIAPVFEEFLVRGAILGSLLKQYSLLKANIISSIMFVCLHVPGWYFMGGLIDNLTKPIGGALSIFLLSLIFGYVVYRSRSVGAGMVTHFLNNFAS